MSSLLILHGYNTIQIYKRVGGHNFRPHTIVWEVCGNTLVNECDYQALNQYRWTMMQVGPRSFIPKREERKYPTGLTHILLPREVLGLPRNPGRHGDVAEHRTGETLDNSRDNLRVARNWQNVVNKKSLSRNRFRGIVRQHNGTFFAHIMGNGLRIHFPTVKTEIEAGLMYHYAATLFHKEFYQGASFPENELPTEERQEELWQIVLKKLRAVGLLDGG